MNDFSRFQNAVIEAALAHIQPSFKKDSRKIGKVLRNRVLNLDGPKVLNEPLNEDDRFIADVFQGFWEIVKSAETLEDIVFYAGRFPFSKTKIAPERYLRFHIEAWFSEAYILQLRLTKYVTTIERRYRADPRYRAIRKKFENLRELSKDALKPITDARGHHIHEFRLGIGDVDRLGEIQLFTRGSENKLTQMLRIYHRMEHQDVKKAWKKRLVVLNKCVRLVLDIYFDMLFPLLFDSKSKSLILPNKPKPKTSSRGATATI